MEGLRVAALTRGQHVPSARFRVRQYLPHLRALGVEVEEHAPRRPAHRLIGRGAPGAWAQAMGTRLGAVAATRKADVTWLQRELVSTYATIEGWTKAPRVFDMDDAIYLKRDGAAGKAIEKIVARCEVAVAGNETLAEWLRPRARRVEIAPTAVDTERYTPAPQPAEGPPVLGWIGTRANLPNLAAIQEPLRRVLTRHPDTKLRVVAEAPPDLPRLPAAQVEFVPWGADAEVGLLRSFTVGLMPLEDTPWNRGKCAFKMLQYMAVGIPAAVAPVGFNRDVLERGEVGLAAADAPAWESALEALLADEPLRSRMGREGRRVVERDFSATQVAAKLAGVFRSVLP
jgi:glycosyltransferase involved in cell wall biosynthesis